MKSNHISRLRLRQNSSTLYNGVLDNPTAEEPRALSDGLLVRGWVFSRHSDLEASIEVNGVMRKLPKAYRPDVNKHVLEKQSNENLQYFYHAFEISLDKVQNFKIIVKADGTRTNWIQGHLTEAESKTAKSQTEQHKDDNPIASGLYEDLIKDLDAAVNFFSKFEFLGALRWSHKLGTFLETTEGIPYILLDGFEEDNVNYLFLLDTAKDLHYVLSQHVIFSAILYQVETAEYRFLNKELSHTSIGQVDSIRKVVARFIDSNLFDYPNTNPPVFVSGEFSLNHYFFDTIPGLLYFSQIAHGSLPRQIRAHKMEFIETIKLISTNWTYELKELDSGRSDILERRPTIRTGLNLTQLSKEKRDWVDATLVNICGTAAPLESSLNWPKIWIDLAQGNREWNQSEVLPRLVQNIVAEYPNALFIFDGMTSINYVKSTPTKIPEWLEILLTQLHVPYLSLLGETAEFKLSVAKHASFFFASYTTGSMFVSRFSNISGIALSAPRTYMAENVKRLFSTAQKILPPAELFEAVDETGNPAWASFSLNPDLFNRWCLEQLKITIGQVGT